MGTAYLNVFIFTKYVSRISIHILRYKCKVRKANDYQYSNYFSPVSGVGKLWHVDQLPVFVKKVLLEHSHAHSFAFCLQLLSQDKG